MYILVWYSNKNQIPFMETHACHENNKMQNELVFGVKSDLNVFLSGFVRFAYLDFYKWRFFFFFT